MLKVVMDDEEIRNLVSDLLNLLEEKVKSLKENEENNPQRVSLEDSIIVKNLTDSISTILETHNK